LDHTSPPDRVLAVDLDGTLIRSDMLYETFWSALAKSWTTPFLALGSLAGGRAALKERLSGLAAVDIGLLPYNTEIVAYVERCRADGWRTVLVTASDQSLADRIAGHLGIFDEAHGSDGATNLKGPHKAEFLEGRFGPGGFAYVGDAAADLAVWKKAGRAVTATTSKGLRARVDGLGMDTEHLATRGGALKDYLRTMRPHQWLKNVLVFLPMIAAHTLLVPTFLQALLAFVVFSLVASSVYVLNDLLDLSADRAHARKRNRPFASGAIPIATGTWLAPLLFISGFLLALPLGWKFVGVMLAYYVTTMAYSLHLKRRIIIDICVLAGLYTLRILAGGVATNTPLSVWLLAFSIFFFFSLAAVKRQAELADALANNKVEAAGRGYRAPDLQLVTSMAISSGYVSVLVMALYANSPNVTQLYNHPSALWGVCLVLFYWISRMVMVTHRRRMHDDPVVFAAKDRVSQICLVLIAILGIAGALP
jgi:4-hydroxybenzoate polyprenyltransferase/phosphoserine phosphatase